MPPKVTNQRPSPVRKTAPASQPTQAADDAWGMADQIRMLLYGESGCLAGDTFISYQIRDSNGRTQNCKGGSIELLYKRFHGIKRMGKGYYQRKQTIGSSFYVSSVTDDGRMVRNLVTDVIDSGDRRVFEVVTESGRVIRATANHPFMTESGYVQLADLAEGMEVLVSPGKRLKQQEAVARIHRPEAMVKYHPRMRAKIVEGCLYYRVPRAHLVYEASVNGMEPDEYRNALNTLSPGEIDLFWTVPAGTEIHHLDENPLNDVADNLVLVGSSSGHQREYHPDSMLRPGMSIYVLPDRITSIKGCGTERVYDVTVAPPFKNFVAAGANGFVVHNSGKTTLAATFPDPLLWLICSGGNRPGELKSIDTPENRQRITPRVIRATSKMRDYMEEADDGRYATVVLDHATGLADLILKEILGLDELPVQKGWGTASQQQYAQLSLQCKEIFRAVLNLPTNIVIIAQQRTFGGKDDGGDPEIIKPTVGAALTPSVTGWLNPACDYVCQMFKRPKMERVKTSVGGKDRFIERRGKGVEYCLRVEPHDIYQTKFRVPGGITQDVIVNPDYDKIIKLIRGEEA